MSIAHDSYRIASHTTVCPDPKAAQGMSMADCGKQMGGSPKASQQHLAKETSLLEVTRSPTAVARVSDQDFGAALRRFLTFVNKENCNLVSWLHCEEFATGEKAIACTLPTEVFLFAFAQGRQNDNEAHKFLCGDDDGFASKPHP